MHTTTPAQELAPWATGNPSLGKRSLPETIDIAIIGAGPQALTLVTHMLQKKATLRRRIVVLDGAGQWMQQWHHQFAAFEIPHLRSPAAHHPDLNLHSLMMEGAAALHLGPVACNLYGVKMGSDSIVPGLMGATVLIAVKKNQ